MHLNYLNIFIDFLAFFTQIGHQTNLIKLFDVLRSINNKVAILIKKEIITLKIVP